MRQYSLAAALLLAASAVHAQIEVSTLADLDNIRNNRTADYVLINDIDASATADPGYNGGEGWVPIGRDGNFVLPFTGTFDGQGFTISGLTFNRPEGTLAGSGNRAGLFADLSVEAAISNLHLVDVDLQGHDLVGGIAGRMLGLSTVTNCSVSGTVRAEFRVGGLVGAHVGGLIENCWTEGEVETFGINTNAGGLVGYADGLIQNSYSTADVSGGSWVGGLVGRMDSNGIVEESFATGDVKGTGSLVGGLVGAQSGPIARSYATGNASGSADAGSVAGLVGRQDEGGELLDSFARGDVMGGANRAGGAVAWQRDDATLIRSFSTGIVAGDSNIGGLLGAQQVGTVTASHWDTESSGIAISAGGEGAIGLTTAEMTTPFGGGAYDGWDFDTVWLEEDDANDGYPIHQWQTVRHTLQYTAGSNGSLEGDLQQVRIPGLSGTPVTAVPDEGFAFNRWSDGSQENPRSDLKVMGDVNVTASFYDPSLMPSIWMIQ